MSNGWLAGQRQAPVAQQEPLDVRDGESFSQAAYRRLRRDVVSGVLRPNQRLVETGISQRLGISRTPVRDALMRLAADGLVDNDRRGWTVHEHNRDELVAIYETRAALEGYAARLAALRATPEELDTMEQVLKFEADLGPGRSEVVADQNLEFHSVMFRSCRNPRLLHLIETNAEFYFNFRIASLYTPDELRQAYEGHNRLLRALHARDAEAAEAAVREHLDQALNVMLHKGRW